jgi:hypothetical protein
MVFFILFLWNMLCGVWANQAGDPVVAQQNGRQKKQVVIKFLLQSTTEIKKKRTLAAKLTDLGLLIHQN